MTDYASWSPISASPPPDHLLTSLSHCLRSLLWNSTHHHCLSPSLLSSVNIGDLVRLSPPGHNPPLLSPEWTGPFRVIFTLPNCTKIKGFPRWINLSRLKPLYHRLKIIPLLTSQPQQDLVLLSFRRYPGLVSEECQDLGRPYWVMSTFSLLLAHTHQE